MIRRLLQPPWRTVLAGALVVLAVGLAMGLWQPGLEVRDGRHDLGRNGIWLAHGWMGADEWFIQNGKTNQFGRYRDADSLRHLAERMRRHHITDLFPHLCPADPAGRLPAWDPVHTERFLDAMVGFRVMPWIGGPRGSSARIHRPDWRTAYVVDVRRLLERHPRLAGVQVSVEPLTSGDADFLKCFPYAGGVGAVSPGSRSDTPGTGGPGLQPRRGCRGRGSFAPPSGGVFPKHTTPG